MNDKSWKAMFEKYEINKHNFDKVKKVKSYNKNNLLYGI